jgi:uncharacterized protein (DUF433 family)
MICDRRLDDPNHPYVTYRCGAAGIPTPVVRGTNVRVQTLVLSARQWQWTSAQIADEYDLFEAQVQDALAFYETHRAEIEASIAAERELELAEEN